MVSGLKIKKNTNNDLRAKIVCFLYRCYYFVGVNYNYEGNIMIDSILISETTKNEMIFYRFLNNFYYFCFRQLS